MPHGQAVGTSIYVSPTGSDTNDGLSAASPLKSVQLALDRATAGATINLAPGAYVGDLSTVKAGTALAPITLRGQDDARSTTAPRTVVYGTGHVIDLNHSYYRLTGFAVDGQQALEAAYRKDHPTSVTGYPDMATLVADPTAMTAFKDKYQASVRDGRLIYVGNNASGLTGITIDNMLLQGGGGECMRMRNSTTGSTVENSVVRYCGLFGKPSKDRYVYHNGEGIYLGTSPKSTDQPQAGSDATSHNVLTHNSIDTFGSECVDVKEVASGNLISDNDCGYNLEPADSDGSNIELRGDHNTVLGNSIHDSLGWNVKLVSDSSTYDRGGNTVSNNTMSSAGHGVSLYSKQSGVTACGNTMSGTVVSASPLGAAAPCPAGSSPSPTASPSPPAPSPSPTATASPTVSASPTASPAGLAIEGETGNVVAPMQVHSDAAAQGGRYVVQTASSGTGKVTFEFSLPAAGRYLLQARVIAPDGSSNSVFRSVDGASPTSWAFPEPITTWTWSSGATLTLTAGHHVLVLSQRESGTMLDTIRLARVPS